VPEGKYRRRCAIEITSVHCRTGLAVKVWPRPALITWLLLCRVRPVSQPPFQKAQEFLWTVLLRCGDTLSRRTLSPKRMESMRHWQGLSLIPLRKLQALTPYLDGSLCLCSVPYQIKSPPKHRTIKYGRPFDVGIVDGSARAVPFRFEHENNCQSFEQTRTNLFPPTTHLSPERKNV
jgi:hypothetical protein